MGIDYSGGMIVGAHGSELTLPEEECYLSDWLEGYNMDFMSEYYDADEDSCYYGFYVNDIPVSEIDDGWLAHIRKLARDFEEITGVPARLIGTQDIY